MNKESNSKITNKKPRLKKSQVKCHGCELVIPKSLAHKTLTKTLCGKCAVVAPAEAV